MNDHNLDDLIIDNINPKNTKTKSLLTIIALAIVVLIIAIILTKTLLKEPNDALDIHAENDTEMISPELTLQNTKKEVQEKFTLETSIKAKDETKLSSEATNISQKESVSKAATPKEDVLKEKVVEKITVEETKPKTVAISQDIFDDAMETDAKTDKDAEEKANQLADAKAKKVAQQKKLAAQKKAKQKALASKIKVTQKAKTKAKTKPKPKPRVKTKPKKPSTTTQNTGRYYIQVGSFKQNSSKQFLSIIKKSGFNYRITSQSSAGTKKLLIGPYSSRGSVDSALPQVRDRINKGAFVVKK